MGISSCLACTDEPVLREVALDPVAGQCELLFDLKATTRVHRVDDDSAHVERVIPRRRGDELVDERLHGDFSSKIKIEPQFCDQMITDLLQEPQCLVKGPTN